MRSSKKRGRRPSKPRRVFPGIEAVWSKSRWKWRARLTVEGRPVVGGLHYLGDGVKADREAQEAAHRDGAAMRTTHARLPRRIATIGEALDAVIADARKRGVPETTVRKQHESHRRYLESFWKPATPLAEIDVDELLWMIGLARADVDEDGEQKKARHVNTLLQKDLPLLDRAFRIADLTSPVAEARKAARLRYITPQMEHLEASTVAKILHDIRHAEIKHEKGRRAGKVRTFREREHHADVLEFFAVSAIRSGEFGRVAVDDVDLDRELVLIRQPKDRSNPRTARIRPRLVPVVQRLVAHALREHLRGQNPEKLLVPGGMSTVSNICRHWKKRLGIKHLHARLMRHSAITGGAAVGAPLPELMNFSGHRRGTSLARYLHAAEGHRSTALDAYADALGPPAVDESKP